VSTLASIISYVSTLDGGTLPGSSSLVVNLDAFLTPVESSKRTAWKAYLDSKVADLVAHDLFSSGDNYQVLIKGEIGSTLGIPQRYYVPGRLRSQYRFRLESDDTDGLDSTAKTDNSREDQQAFKRAFAQEKVYLVRIPPTFDLTNVDSTQKLLVNALRSFTDYWRTALSSSRIGEHFSFTKFGLLMMPKAYQLRRFDRVLHATPSEATSFRSPSPQSSIELLSGSGYSCLSHFLACISGCSHVFHSIPKNHASKDQPTPARDSVGYPLIAPIWPNH